MRKSAQQTRDQCDLQLALPSTTIPTLMFIHIYTTTCFVDSYGRASPYWWLLQTGTAPVSQRSSCRAIRPWRLLGPSNILANPTMHDGMWGDRNMHGQMLTKVIKNNISAMRGTC